MGTPPTGGGYHPPMSTAESALPRCPWSEGSAMERDYHDRAWGVPVVDESFSAPGR